MSASTLGVSLSNSETRFDDPFQQHLGTRNNGWPLQTSRSRKEEIDPFSFGRVWQPYTGEFSLYHQKQSPAFSPPVIEDEETRHGFISHIHNLQVSTHNQLQGVEVSSPSFSPYSEYGRYPFHPLGTQYPPMEHTVVSTVTGELDSLASEQPTDLSMPKIVPQNLDSGWSADQNPRENIDGSQGTSDGRSESPIRRLTYTHLSDVSNDSEEDSDENLKIPKTLTGNFAKKRFEKLGPHQLALPWISTHSAIERPNVPTIDTELSYVQMMVHPSVVQQITSYILWVFQLRIFDMINELANKVPEHKQKQKIVVLGEDDFSEDDIPARNIGDVADEYLQPAADECEVIDLTQDDDDDDDDDDGSEMGSEQLQIQPAPSNQQLLAEIPKVEERMRQIALSLQGSIPPELMHMLPPASYFESSTLSVDSIMSPEKNSIAHHFLSQPSTSRNTSAQQNCSFSPSIINGQLDSPRDNYMRHDLTEASSTEPLLPDSVPKKTRGKRLYRESEPVCEATHCSVPKQLRRSPRLQSLANESTCASAKRDMQPQNHQEPEPPDQRAQCVAPSQPRSSAMLEDEARKCTHATEKRRREPWNHKGLWRFVAQNAFSLPRHVWTERKEGQKRRSMRLAKKMQRRTYLLRPRLRTKS